MHVYAMTAGRLQWLHAERTLLDMPACRYQYCSRLYREMRSALASEVMVRKSATVADSFPVASACTIEHSNLSVEPSSITLQAHGQ